MNTPQDPSIVEARRREYARVYREKNREAILAKQRAYSEKNREAINARQRAYNEKNREAILAKLRAYNEKNREAIKAHKRAHYQKNREAILAQKRAYENREAIKARKRAYREENREAILAKQRAYYHKNKEKNLEETRARNRARGAGLSLEQVDFLFNVVAGGRCQICDCEMTRECRKANTFCADHIHGTKIVRGALCLRCNAVLGKYETKGWDVFAFRDLLPAFMQGLFLPPPDAKPVLTYQETPQRAVWIKRKYGISINQWRAMWEHQGGRCAICDAEMTAWGSTNKKGLNGVNTDHCHQSGQVRGLLCNHCNVALGNIEKGWDFHKFFAGFEEHLNRRFTPPADLKKNLLTA